jgi:hypothetical protein
VNSRKPVEIERGSRPRESGALSFPASGGYCVRRAPPGAARRHAARDRATLRFSQHRPDRRSPDNRALVEGLDDPNTLPIGAELAIPSPRPREAISIEEKPLRSRHRGSTPVPARGDPAGGGAPVSVSSGDREGAWNPFISPVVTTTRGFEGQARMGGWAAALFWGLSHAFLRLMPDSTSDSILLDPFQSSHSAGLGASILQGPFRIDADATQAWRGGGRG